MLPRGQRAQSRQIKKARSVSSGLTPRPPEISISVRGSQDPVHHCDLRTRAGLGQLPLARVNRQLAYHVIGARPNFGQEVLVSVAMEYQLGSIDISPLVPGQRHHNFNPALPRREHDCGVGPNPLNAVFARGQCPISRGKAEWYIRLDQYLRMGGRCSHSHESNACHQSDCRILFHCLAPFSRLSLLASRLALLKCIPGATTRTFSADFMDTEQLLSFQRDLCEANGYLWGRRAAPALPGISHRIGWLSDRIVQGRTKAGNALGRSAQLCCGYHSRAILSTAWGREYVPGPGCHCRSAERDYHRAHRDRGVHRT